MRWKWPILFLHERKCINKAFSKDEINVEKNEEDEMMFEKYKVLCQELPDYFFRAPISAADCYGNIMDALDVLLEDRDILSSWELNLDCKIAKLELQKNS